MDAKALARLPARAPGSVNGPDACATDAGERMLALLEGDLRQGLAAAELDDVVEAARFHPAGYCRVLLARTADAEALVMGWLPGQGTLVHDHGLSHGFVKILAGEMVDESFALVGDRAARLDARRVGAGSIVEERPDQVHRVVNASENVLITLHAYAPCLRGVRTYELA